MKGDCIASIGKTIPLAPAPCRLPCNDSSTFIFQTCKTHFVGTPASNMKIGLNAAWPQAHSDSSAGFPNGTRRSLQGTVFPLRYIDPAMPASATQFHKQIKITIQCPKSQFAQRFPANCGHRCRAIPRKHAHYAPAAYIRSRSASELLLAQKTKLPRLTTVCSGDGLIARLVSSNKPDTDAPTTYRRYAIFCLNTNLQKPNSSKIFETVCYRRDIR
jgi:hypothetical protein